MRIALLTPYFSPHRGGTEKYVEMLANALVERGDEVTVFTSQLPKDLPREESCGNLTIKRFPAWEIWNIPWRMKLPKNILAGFDVVHSHGPPFNLTRFAAGVKDCPHVVTYHSDVVTTPRFFGFWMPGLACRFINWVFSNFTRGLLRQADAIVTTTKEYGAASSALTGLCYKVIPIGISNDDWSKAREKFSQAKRNSQQLLFVGRLVEHKGVSLLLKAFAQIVKNFPQAGLTIVGEGPEKKRLQTQVLALGLNDRVIFTGEIAADKLTGWYCTSAALVLPSRNRYESFGIVQLEALACATPVIVADLPGVSHLVKRYKTGLDFFPDNLDELVDKITWVFDNPYAAGELGRKGQGVVAENHDIVKITVQMEKLYRSLLQN